MIDLLNRTLGGAVTLHVALADDLWMTRADPSEIENAILQPCRQCARCHADGGQLAITTSNSRIEAGLAAADPGSWAATTSCCRSPTRGQACRPTSFARRSNLSFNQASRQRHRAGLATIYGFARQSNGNMTIASEPGRGTTVKIYLPREHGSAAGHVDGEDTVALERGCGETILVVEDDPAMQASVNRLRSLGYRTIAADSGAAAVRTLQGNREIDLVFSDVVMPRVCRATGRPMGGGEAGQDRLRLTSGFQGDARPTLAPTPLVSRSCRSGSKVKTLLARSTSPRSRAPQAARPRQ